MDKFISKYSGEQIDNIVGKVLQLQPKIHIINAFPNSFIKCSSSAILNPINSNVDSTGECIIPISRYGEYNVEASYITKGVDIEEYSKIYELDFSSEDEVPEIITPPISQSVTVGSTVTLTITATNATAYQWQYSNNGIIWTNGSSTSDTYSWVASISQNGRQYRCIVSNDNYQVISNFIILTVEAAQGNG